MHLTIIEMQFKLIIFKCKTPIFTLNPAICSSFTSITLQSCTFYNLWLFSQKISSLNKATIQACPGTGDFASYSNRQLVKKHETLTMQENNKSPAISFISPSILESDGSTALRSQVSVCFLQFFIYRVQTWILYHRYLPFCIHCAWFSARGRDCSFYPTCFRKGKK